MICKDCLIWENRREDLVYQNTKLWDDMARFSLEALTGLAKIIPHLRQEFVRNELLRDEECPNGICLLLQEALI